MKRLGDISPHGGFYIGNAWIWSMALKNNFWR